MSDAYIVVRVDDRDVATVRRAIHAAAVTQDAVFRPGASPANRGVNLYDTLQEGMARVFVGHDHEPAPVECHCLQFLPPGSNPPSPDKPRLHNRFCPIYIRWIRP